MPSIRPEQLEQHLARQLAPLYVIHGDEPLLALEATDAIRARARKVGFTERRVLLAERHFKWGELGAAASTMSLFGERLLVELRIPSGRPGTEGAEAIERWCASPPPDAFLLVTLPRLPKRDQSAGWYAALARTGVVVEVWPVERSKLPDWIAARLARQKQRAGRDTLQFLSDAVEGNLLAAHQEIQKLGMLLPEGELSPSEVRAAVLDVARYDAGDLTEAMLAGDVSRLVRMLDGLRAEGEALPRLLWIVAEDIRSLCRVQEGLAAGRPYADLCRENRIWGEPRTTLFGRAARRLSKAALHDALSHAARIDRISKGVGQGDPWDELLGLGLRLAA